jgi:hypothetical protein
LLVKLEAIKKESNSSSSIVDKMGTDSTSEALRILFEVTSLVEVLWNQMIAFETTIIYKNQTKDDMFSRTMVNELDEVFKGFDNFFSSRTISYKKAMEILVKTSEVGDGHNRDHGPGKLAKSISHFDPLYNKIINQKKISKTLMKHDFSARIINKDTYKPNVKHPMEELESRIAKLESPDSKHGYVRALKLDNFELNSNL